MGTDMGAKMPIIKRSLEPQLKQLVDWFPVVTVTGPRQSGKTTLVRNVFPDRTYVNLEDPRLRAAAREDPMGFLEDRPKQLIIDEAQNVPELFSALQVIVDESADQAQYVLSGSQNFALLKAVKQSLAGRVGMLRLLPLSLGELAAQPEENQDPKSAQLLDFSLRGGYPRLRVKGMKPATFFDAYIETYLERDVAGLLDVRNIASYREVLRLLAHNAGKLLNYSRLANDAGVALNTVRGWVAMLESSYLIFTLQPFHANLRKRLTRTPKVYFHDTGLLCHLLGIRTTEQLVESEYFGAVFENLVIEETLKSHHNNGRQPALYFYRDDSKREADLIDLTIPETPRIAEIKSSTMYHHHYARTLNAIADDISVPADNRWVILRGGDARDVDGVHARSVADWLDA